MNRRNFAIAAIVLGLAALGLPASASAADFSADLTAVFTGAHDGTMEGIASHMGQVAGAFRDKSSHGADHHETVFTLENGKGDTLSFASVVDRVEPGVAVWVGTYTITGGTGRFAGATGGGDMVVDGTDVGDALAVLLNGTID